MSLSLSDQNPYPKSINSIQVFVSLPPTKKISIYCSHDHEVILHPLKDEFLELGPPNYLCDKLNVYLNRTTGK